MSKNFNRIRVWTEQLQITIPQLFFKHYSELNIQDDEALIILHLLTFEQEGIDFPTPNDLMQRTNFQLTAISQIIQRLMQKGYVEISQSTDESGRLAEKYSIYPLWERLLDLLQSKAQQQVSTANKLDEAKIFQLFEQELGRLLSPMEIETIGMWMDLDQHSPEIIKAALKEAVLADKVNLRYIDRILIEWKKRNIKTLAQIEKHSEQYRKNTMAAAPIQPVHQQETVQKTEKVSFYNWLEERE
ncbi:DnaD domain-containing protein [Solibacillus isronensis]|uniref:DnaD domain-containing protein n=1 Tax=Solibacillus isronensis TaxID=412383 RepID=UPI00203FF577|nr:DnaD domain-containing protein [Solibacillus isronensis]MCM3721877.1 DnaD domain-containing protein [Solibacillus isronensis]